MKGVYFIGRKAKGHKTAYLSAIKDEVTRKIVAYEIRNTLD